MHMTAAVALPKAKKTVGTTNPRSEMGAEDLSRRPRPRKRGLRSRHPRACWTSRTSCFRSQSLRQTTRPHASRPGASSPTSSSTRAADAPEEEGWREEGEVRGSGQVSAAILLASALARAAMGPAKIVVRRLRREGIWQTWRVQGRPEGQVR